MKRLKYLLLLVLPLFFVSSANAWELTDPFFSSSNTLDYYLSYMTQAEGAPYIQNDVFFDNVTPSTYILTATDSAIQTKTLFGYYVTGYEFNGDDKTKTYHSAQAILYFTIYNSSYISIKGVPIKARYVITNDSNDFLYQNVDCRLSYSQSPSPPYEVAVSIECPQVTLKRVGYHYKWFDLYVGSVSNNDSTSDYFYRYTNGGGIKPSATVGQYIVSSTDNASELALEQITEQNQTIINQNQTIIEQNQQVIDQNNQDRQDLQNQSNSSQSSAASAASSVNSAGSSLLVIIGNFINIVTNPPQSDCVIDGDLGNMDLGYIDLCQLDLPQPLQVLATILLIGMIIPFAYSLIMTILSLLKGATQD